MKSLPIAALTGFKVVSIDYRMAPEHVFPAASEDVEAVYRVLLNSYKASAIGMYGCSAGGVLSAPSGGMVAQPRPAATRRDWHIGGEGGSRHERRFRAFRQILGRVRARADLHPAAGAPPPPPPAPIRSYFEGADLADPLVSPAS